MLAAFKMKTTMWEDYPRVAKHEQEMLKYQIDIHDDIFKKNITPMAPSSSP
jgi:hypothetical protein